MASSSTSNNWSWKIFSKEDLKNFDLRTLFTDKWYWIKVGIAFFAIPIFLMFLGMIIDGIIYDKAWVFHARCLIILGFCVAPFILFRWTWKWKENQLFLFDALVYTAFFICYNLYLVNVTCNSEGYYFTKTMRVHLAFDADNGFYDIASVDDIYDWLRGPVDEYLFPKLDTNDSTSELQFAIPLTTYIRLRQVRVDLENCTDPYFKYVICIPTYSTEVEAKDPYGPNGTYVWESADYKNIGMKTITPIPRKAATYSLYPKSGYYFDINSYHYINDSTWFDNFVDELQANNWITVETKVVSLEIVPYNPSADVWGYAGFDIELTSGGSVEPWYPTIIIGKIPDFGEATDATKSGDKRAYYPLYGYLISFLLFFICAEVNEMIQHKKKYWLKGDNYVDWLIIIIIIIGWIFRLISDYYWPWAETPEARQLNPSPYIDLSSTAKYWLTSRELIGAAGFLVYFNLLKFLKIFPQFGVLPRTLMRALGRVTVFFVSFLICLMGFAMAFFTVFGDSLIAVQDPFTALVTCWRAMLGDADIGFLVSVDPVFAYILYILFTFITVFVLLTMLIAIIGDAYNEIQERYFKSPEAREMASQKKKEVLAMLSEPVMYGLNRLDPNREAIELDSIRASVKSTIVTLNQTNNKDDSDEESGSNDAVVLMKQLLMSMEEIKSRLKKLEEKK